MQSVRQCAPTSKPPALFVAIALAVACLCLALMLTPKPLLGFALVLATFALFALSLKVETCLLGFILLLPCIPRSFYTPAVVLPFGLDFTRAYFPFLLLGLGFHWIFRVKVRPMATPGSKWLVLWVIVTTVALFRALDFRNALLQKYIPFMAAVLCYALFLSYARKREDVERLFKVMIAASLFVVFFALFEVVLGRNPFWKDVRVRGGQTRLASSLENPQVLGTYLLFCLSAGFVFFRRAKSRVLRLSWLVLLIVYLAVILLTLTRSAWLGVVVIGLLLVRRKRAYVLMGSLGLLIYFSPIFSHYVSPVLTSFEAQQNIFHRFYVYKKALFIIKDHYIAGVGLNNFVHYSLEYDQVFAGTRRHLHDPGSHNTYFTFAAELGFLGFLGLFGLLWSSIRRILPLYREPEKYAELGVTGCALFVGLIAMLGTGLTYQAFQWGTLVTPLLVLTACCQVLGNLLQEKTDSEHVSERDTQHSP